MKSWPPLTTRSASSSPPASLAAPSTPLKAIGAGLEAAAQAFAPERRDLGPKMQDAIAASTELRERETLKRVGLATAMTDALKERGISDPTASLAAEVGVLALKIAHARWADPTNRQELAALARQSLQELQTASATLIAEEAATFWFTSRRSESPCQITLSLDHLRPCGPRR